MKNKTASIFWLTYVTAIVILVWLLVTPKVYPMNGYMADSNYMHSEIKP